ncbi:MAG TPA: LemA family protein [Candidatus Saccharimonadales bacterium]|nr:LemA family protein [Candidatus Saccharimonadales bacterium]
MTWIIVGVIVVILAILLIGMYNGLVRLNQQVEEAWSDIKVQLKRRLDLIPNLVNTVKGYAKHEKEVFENVTKARANTLNAQTPKETAAAENQFEQALKSLFAVAEAYPQLRATENFQALQAELTDTEDKIMASRRFYNGSVRDFNTKRKVFPTNIFAGMLGFNKDKEYFELDDSEVATANKPVDVNFNEK